MALSEWGYNKIMIRERGDVYTSVVSVQPILKYPQND